MILGTKAKMFSKNWNYSIIKRVLCAAKATVLWQRHCHMYKSMKIFPVNSRTVNFLFVYSSKYDYKIQGNVIKFFVHCRFGIALRLDNTGQSWGSMDHTQHFALSTFWPVPIRPGIKCGKRLGAESGQQSPFASVLSNRWTCQEEIHQKLRIHFKVTKRNVTLRLCL